MEGNETSKIRRIDLGEFLTLDTSFGLYLYGKRAYTLPCKRIHMTSQLNSAVNGNVHT